MEVRDTELDGPRPVALEQEHELVLLQREVLVIPDPEPFATWELVHQHELRLVRADRRGRSIIRRHSCEETNLRDCGLADQQN